MTSRHVGGHWLCCLHMCRRRITTPDTPKSATTGNSDNFKHHRPSKHETKAYIREQRAKGMREKRRRTEEKPTTDTSVTTSSNTCTCTVAVQTTTPDTPESTTTGNSDDSEQHGPEQARNEGVHPSARRPTSEGEEGEKETNLRQVSNTSPSTNNRPDDASHAQLGIDRHSSNVTPTSPAAIMNEKREKAGIETPPDRCLTCNACSKPCFFENPPVAKKKWHVYHLPESLPYPPPTCKAATDGKQDCVSPAFAQRVGKKFNKQIHRSKRTRSNESQASSLVEGKPKCTICSMPMKGKGTAHATCTRPFAHVQYSRGNMAVKIKRDKQTKKFTCIFCEMQFYPTDDIVASSEHAKTCSAGQASTSTQTIVTGRILGPPTIPNPLITTNAPPAAVRPRVTRTAPPRTSARLLVQQPLAIAALENAPAPPSPQPSSIPDTISIPPDTRPPSPAGSTWSLHHGEAGESLQTPLLSKYGLIVKPHYKVLLCVDCKSAVNPSNIRQHFTNQHPHFSTPPDLHDQIIAESEQQYPDLTYRPGTPPRPVEMIDELGPPMDSLLMCKGCHHCYSSKEVFRKHPCNTNNPMFTPTLAQRWVPNSSHPWFAVKQPVPKKPTQLTPWMMYQRQRQHENLGVNSSAAQTDDFRILHQFLRKERWLEIVDGRRHEDLIPLVEYSTLDPTYGTLSKHIHAFFYATQNSIDTYYLRRVISIRPAEEQEQKRVKHHANVNFDTQKNYARITAAMIAFIHRVTNDENAPHKFPIPIEITTACRDLIQHLSPPLAGTEVGEDQGEEEGSGSQAQEGASDDSEQEVLHDLESQGSTGRQKPPPSTPEIQQRLVTLLYLLFTQTPTGDCQGGFFSPISHFVVISSLRKNENWAAGNTITHEIAPLLFTGRLTFAHKIIKIAKEQAFTQVEHYFNERSQAPLPYLYLLKRGLGSLDSAEQTTISFNAPDLSGTSVIIGDKTLSVSDIGALHRRAIEEIEQELDELTFHHPQFQLPPDTHIHDEPRERESGYSFLVDKRNGWNKQPSLTQHILDTPDLFAKYAYTTQGKRVSWKPTCVATQLKRIFDLQEKLICNIILSYGEPARGSELASHLLANVGGGSIRNFFVLFGDIPVLRASYSKTTSTTDSDKPICRVPHLPIGRQFVRFLVYLRPLYIEWQDYL
ncbi:hypothetical protein D9756_011154 [Leucocoprinus leucothites]|uniref:Uncharacterized protein n=1 Tax=Leucocoprinus leucothites TaxID=201217 RepID=A0A8H5CNJ3_9AGAR|nr:hypothetical protein D9756_011154 [Leucoagaricus leucothites]